MVLKGLKGFRETESSTKELAVEVIVPTYHYYAMTLRKCKLPVVKEDYERRLKEIETLGIMVEDVVYENTSGLHCHGLAKIEDNFNFKKVRKRGWNVKFEQVYDYIGWLAYMMKDQSQEEGEP